MWASKVWYENAYFRLQKHFTRNETQPTSRICIMYLPEKRVSVLYVALKYLYIPNMTVHRLQRHRAERADGKEAETDGQSDKDVEWEKRFPELRERLSSKPLTGRCQTNSGAADSGFSRRRWASEQPLEVFGWCQPTLNQLSFSREVVNDQCKSMCVFAGEVTVCSQSV